VRIWFTVLAMGVLVSGCTQHAVEPSEPDDEVDPAALGLELGLDGGWMRSSSWRQATRRLSVPTRPGV
jgi:hypothetical protein